MSEPPTTIVEVGPLGMYNRLRQRPIVVLRGIGITEEMIEAGSDVLLDDEARDGVAVPSFSRELVERVMLAELVERVLRAVLADRHD
jgi:hypothetical protein